MNETTHHFRAEDTFSLPSMAEQQRMIEAILFACKEPLNSRQLAERLPQGCDVGEALVALKAHYEGRGVRLVRVGEGWAFRTAADLGFLMSQEVTETRKLSRAAVETLAIIAYHQPVTRAEIEEIRGVSVSGGTIDLLIELGWVRFGRRRMSPGRPATLVVTPDFLDHFGLASESDLPGVAELRAAGLLDNRPAPASSVAEALSGGADGHELSDDDEEMPEEELQPGDMFA